MIPSSAILRCPKGLWLLALLAAYCACATTASAQNEDLKALAAKKSEVTRMLRDDDVQQPLFNDYFNKYLLPQFSAGQGALADTYPRLRKDLKTFSNTGKGDALKQLNQLVVAKMKEILAKSDNAAKVNAVLVLGELTEIGSDGKPKPLAESLTYLMGAASLARFPDAVKLAAMYGLERYAAAGAIPEKQAVTLSQLCLKLLQQAEPPAGRSASGHIWMRRSAAQILARFGSPGPNDVVLNAMAEIAADPTARPTFRCEMAHCIGQLKIPSGTKVDLRALANALGHQAVEICRQEIDQAIADKRPPSRRLLMYSVVSAREGVERLQSAAAGTENSKFIAETNAKLKAMFQELDDLDLQDDSVADTLSPKIDELQNLLGPKAQIAKQKDKDAVAAAAGKDKPVEPVKQ